LSLYNKDIVLENKEAGYIKFKTKKMGLCIFPDGNVGIGTTQGNAKLNLVAIKEDALFIKNINNPNGYGIKCEVNNIETNAFAVFNGQFDCFVVKGNGKTGIGVPNPEYMLDVNGIIRGCEFIVEETAWCDFVFDDDYNLTSLDSLREFIDLNKHLPDVPTTEEVKEEGVKLSEMNVILLQKVEELTLYILELEQRITELEEDE